VLNQYEHVFTGPESAYKISCMISDAGQAAEAAPDARATSFGAAARDYDRYRVGPPADVVDRVLPRDVGAVLDLGAGTGAMTRRLHGRAARVYAVDPDPRMTELLARSCPEVEVREGTAEHIPLPDDCVDAVVVSSAWHWVEPAAAIPEVARVLKPGGSLCLLWNRRDRSVPWVADLEAFRRDATGGDDWVEQRIRHYLEEPWLPPGSPFGRVEVGAAHWTAAMTKGEVVRLMTTFHAYIAAPPEQKPEMLRKFTEYVDGDGRIVTTGTGTGESALVQVPMVCHSWRARLD
jgi:SAM-dependent methyltransferase